MENMENMEKMSGIDAGKYGKFMEKQHGKKKVLKSWKKIWKILQKKYGGL